MQNVKGLAVVVYAECLTTKQMRYHRLSRRVNNRAIMTWFLDITRGTSKKEIQAQQKLVITNNYYLSALLFMQH